MNMPAGLELRVINGVAAVWVHSGCRVELAGCHHYQDGIAAAVGGKTPDGHDDDVVAWLVPEPSNAYDRNAVRVDINGHKVGYLPRDYAEMFQPGIIDLVTTYGRPIACAGRVKGGQNRPYKRGKGVIDREFEVRVDFTIPMRAVTPPPTSGPAMQPLMPARAAASAAAAPAAASHVASGPPRWFWVVLAVAVIVLALFGGCALLVAVAPSPKPAISSSATSATSATTVSASAAPAKLPAKPQMPSKR